MSASLVGSEMCIRDRSCVLRPLVLAVVAPLWVQAGGEALERPPEPAEAVSYTHLTLPTICSV
eukprot:12618864-Alexandrium_andersonii.AAC.1